MALIHELENSGNWLFKRRGWLPVVFIIPSILFLWFSPPRQYDILWEGVFIAIGLAGQLIRALTVGRTPKGTSGRNIKGQVASQVNTTGIYSLVRHPLYLGNFLMWLAPVLFIRSIWFTLLFSLLYWIYYERIMFAEEQFLRRKFGEEYDLWAEKVRAFIPGIRNYKKSDLPFSFRNVLKREYHGFANMFIIFTILDLTRNYINESKVYLSPLWMWSIIIAMSAWIIIRLIVKTSSFLDVKGR